MFLLLLACAAPPADDSASSTSSVCRGDLAPGAVEEVATGFTSGTEGLSFVGGRLFVSVPDGVMEVLPDGTVARLATTTSALGLAPWSGGLAVAAPGAFTLDGSGDDGEVLHVGLDGVVDPLAQGLPNPNFVVATPWGSLLVDDDTNETIWQLGDTGALPWLDGVPSPNGMGFSPDGRTLYVVSTFVSDPPLWAVPIGADGAPGTPVALATLPTASTPDGLAVAADGSVVVAANLAGELVAVDPNTGATTTLASGLDTPASIAFGDGETWDACSLYATSLYGDAVVRVGLDRAGPIVPR